MTYFSAFVRGWQLTCLLLVLAGLTVCAQSPSWQRASTIPMGTTGINGPIVSTITATATDASGNVYVVGSFAESITLGSTTLYNTDNNTGTRLADGIFIAKWSPISNGYVWAQQITSTGNYTTVKGLAVNGASIYIAGSFSGTSFFGSSSLISTGGTNAFVAKLTDLGTSGNFIWAQQASGRWIIPASLAINGTDLYVSGWFDGPTANFGNAVLNNSAATGVNSVGYVAKLTDQGTSGSFVWAKILGRRADAVATNGTSVYVTGYFTGTSYFGGIALTGNFHNAFVAKLTDTGTDGNFVWVQRAGGNNNGFTHSHAVAVNGPNVYIAGAFGGTANYQIQFGSLALTPFDYQNVYVAKLTDAGSNASFAWVQQAGSTARAGRSPQDSAVVLAVKGANVYVGGVFNSLQAHFGNTTLTNLRAVPNPMYSPSSDCFIAKLADLGNNAVFEWAQQAGGPGSDFISGLATSSNTLYAVGTVNLPGSFGSIGIPSSTSFSTGFLASLTDPALLATSAAQGSLSFTLAPNPARNAATVQLPAVPGAATATLTLTDALGRTLRIETVQLPATGLRHALDLTGLAPGLYAVQVRAGTTSGIQRLVVE